MSDTMCSHLCIQMLPFIGLERIEHWKKTTDGCCGFFSLCIRPASHHLQCLETVHQSDNIYKKKAIALCSSDGMQQYGDSYQTDYRLQACTERGCRAELSLTWPRDGNHRRVENSVAAFHRVLSLLSPKIILYMGSISDKEKFLPVIGKTAISFQSCQRPYMLGKKIAVYAYLTFQLTYVYVRTLP